MTEPITRSPRDKQYEEKEDKKKKRLLEKKRLYQGSNPLTSAPKMAKGGRAGFKSGMRVCKLAKKGKGKAYGKNS